ncbi:MAG: ABC transporter permease subunit [Pseudotabrizicola sp.]|uniref:ABC transporter permease n=1 Tax=Pseudotabrizicola sp. TaxID=2939647 RepID=UPI0027242478|nr:ABC transporter permease subunit [Pseudotabrizicola sp.]MDO8882127.1 ABC transporter permease subunit [Pseudotabrizicola sp.]MDP2080175.1 ABC transporter permease subunit [Pseudotabrizicola sp.]MDZ7572330.1 ABC transporter permease subunit [Pseudotabrizicola sp.]
MTASRLGWGLLVALICFALLAPLGDPLGPFRQSLTKALSGAEAAAPFGYDHLGRSMFSRLAHALRLSLLLAFAATATAAAIGIAFGALASWRAGWIDRALSLLADSMLALPALLMVLMMGVILSSTPLAFWAGLAAVQWIEFFRLTRSAARSHLASPAAVAATLQGFGPIWIFRRILWPEIGPMLRTTIAFGVANSIAAIAALGFVSVGMRAPTPELGLMMVELLPSWREAPFALLQPVLACFTLLLALNLIAGARK